MEFIDPYFLAFMFFGAWAFFGVFWLFRRKLNLLKKHGFDKNNDYLIALAKKGDYEANRLLRDSRIFVAIGIIGFLTILVIGSKQ